MHVIKRDGRSQELDITKIQRLSAFACADLNASKEELNAHTKIQLFNGIKTSDIHDAQILAAASLISRKNPDYTYVAARLLLMKTFKEVTGGSIEYPHLSVYIERGVREGVLERRLSHFDLATLNSAIEPSRDYQFTYLGLQTLTDRYLLRAARQPGQSTSPIIELPQHFFMRVAMGLALRDVTVGGYPCNSQKVTGQAIEFYNLLSQFDFMSSTPTLFNSGTPHSQMSSCFLNTVKDSLLSDDGDHPYASIYGTITECAAFSKWGGGIGTDWTRVRGAGDVIKGTNGKSAGTIPYLKVFNDTAVAVNQGGKRNGAFAAYMEPWHPDFMTFCDIKKNSGDERARAHDIFPACWMPDLFFKRVKEQGVWSFFSPARFPELHELYGNEFEARYEALEAAGEFTNQLPATTVWRKIITSLFETGHPWVTFKDEANRRNPQSHVGGIHNSNLCCMTADQRVVTDRGMLTVGELYATQIEPKVAGRGIISQASAMLLPRPNAPIGKIHTKEGYEHKVTPDHRVWVYGKGWIEAQNLVAGDKLELQHTPLFGTVDKPGLAFIAGLVAGDGTFGGDARIDLWKGKTDSLSDEVELCVASAISDSHIEVVRAPIPASDHPAFVDATVKLSLQSAALTRALAAEGFTKLTKLVVPNFVWRGTQATVEQYLRGLYVTDGTVQFAKSACVVSLSSVSYALLSSVQLLWANLGVKSSLVKMRDAGVRDMPNGKGGVAPYACQKVYRLLITSRNACAIAERVTGIGKLRGNLDFTKSLGTVGYNVKMVATFTGFERLPNEDAYCLRVDSDDHAWTVNGLITHNTEIILNTSDDESAVCNLGSINLARHVKGGEVDYAKLRQTVQTAIRMLDNVIDINFYPSDRAKNSNLRHRPIGLGAMGLSDMLAQCGIDWESWESVEFQDELFEHISYYAIEASSELARDRGTYPSFVGSKWSRGILPIDTARENTKTMDWGKLREKVALHGMRNSNVMAIAPTATIANITGVTPAIEPPYELEYTKGNLSGDFKVIAPASLYDFPTKSAFDVKPLWLIRAAAKRQKWIDQSQSVNLFVPSDIKGRELSDIYLSAWEQGLKTTYYLRRLVVEVDDMKVNRAAEPEPEAEGKFCSISDPDCESCQ